MPEIFANPMPMRNQSQAADAKIDVLPRIKPMSLRLVRKAFDDPGFLFVLKHDGFRAVCYNEDGCLPVSCRAICAADLERIVAKRKMSVYKPGGTAGSKLGTELFAG